MGVNVRDLLPAYCDVEDNALDAGNLRLAFRAACMFYVEAGCSLPPAQLSTTRIDSEQMHKMLCEAYARAVFETLFARYFDRADVRTDQIQLRNIEQLFGAKVALRVRADVAARGVVLDDVAQLTSLEVGPTVPAPESAE